MNWDHEITCIFIPCFEFLYHILPCHAQINLTPLSSAWKEPGEKQPTAARLMQTRPAAVEELSSSRQRDRQTGGMPTQTVCDEKPSFCRGAWRTETKASKSLQQWHSVTERKTDYLTEKKKGGSTLCRPLLLVFISCWLAVTNYNGG